MTMSRGLTLLAAVIGASTASAADPIGPTAGLSTTAAAASETTPDDAGLRLRDLPLEERDLPSRGLPRYLPGASMTSDGVRLRGGAAAARFVDGFRVYNLDPPVPFLRAVDVVSAGYGLALADAPEGAILLSSSAPDRVHADAELSYERQSILVPRPEDAEHDSFRSARVLGATLAAPLYGDRLHLTGSVSHTSHDVDGTRDPEGLFPEAPGLSARRLRAALAARFAFTPNQSIAALGLLSDGERLNGGGLGVAAAAQPFEQDRRLMAGLRWTGTFTPWLRARVQGGREHTATDDRSMLCRHSPETCESVPALINTHPRTAVIGNRTEFQRWRETRAQLAAAIEADLGDADRARHRLRLATTFERADFQRGTRAPGDGVRYETTVGGGPLPESRTDYFANDPRVAPAAYGWAESAVVARRSVTTLEDELQLWRHLVVTPGFGVTDARANNGDATLAARALLWHVGALWDVTGGGGTWLRASTSRRAGWHGDQPGQLMPSPSVSRRCRWDEATKSFSRDCAYAGGAHTRTVGLPCGPTGYANDGSRCAIPTALARTTEHTFGARQRVTARSWLDLDLVYRRTSNLPSLSETNRIWNNSGTALANTGGYRNGRAETIYDLSSSPESFRRYAGGTLSFAGALGPVRGLVATTYARQERSYEELVSLFGPAEKGSFVGPDPDDARLGVRLAGSVDVRGAASFGLTYAYDAGRPYSRLFVNNVDNNFSSYRARVGTDPGVDLNDPADDRELRLPATQTLNLQARLRLGRWLPVAADLYLEVLNAFAEKYPGSALQPNRWIRVGTTIGL